MKNPVTLNLSENYDDRPFEAVIDTIVLHYTGMRSTEEALARLCDDSREARERGRVSAHYLIDEDGKIFVLVDERDRAWHAGKSYWRGRTNLNDTSIGIELSNPGHEFGYHAFPRAQLDSLIEVCQTVFKRHPIKKHLVLGHSDVAPGRKMDPGEKFNWRLLARNGVGLWPVPISEDYERGQLYLSSPTILRGALIKYGYDPDIDLDVMCSAFNRHYAKTDSPVITWEVAAMLSCLGRLIGE